uniref:Uncharacterized protein n=2 Tax=Nymphaea colorata TaxID=210225 RepID=A0A5K0WUU4_9MAGN
MASLAPHHFLSPSSSAHSSPFASASRSQSAADGGPVVVAMAKRDVGEGAPTPDIMRGAMMDSDSKRPWWAPIFGIGRETTDPAPESSSKAGEKPDEAEKEERKPPGANRAGLTAEKARLLRKELRSTENWHDAMYHSAIASRLACPDHP